MPLEPPEPRAPDAEAHAESPASGDGAADAAPGIQEPAEPGFVQAVSEPVPATPAPSSVEPSLRIRPGLILLYALAGLAGIALAFVLAFVFVAQPIAAKSATKDGPDAPAAAETVGEEDGVNRRNELRMPPPAEAALTRAETGVVVLNGGGEKGAASQGADELRALGYSVISFGNAPNQNYRRTLVLYTSGHRGEAEQLARDLQIPRRRVSPVDGMRKAELQDAAVVLIVGK